MKAQVKLEKLDVPLSQTSTSFENSAPLAEMLPLPNHGRNNEPELTPQQRRIARLKPSILNLDALARQKLVLMIFEDAHYAGFRIMRYLFLPSRTLGLPLD